MQYQNETEMLGKFAEARQKFQTTTNKFLFEQFRHFAEKHLEDNYRYVVKDLHSQFLAHSARTADKLTLDYFYWVLAVMPLHCGLQVTFWEDFAQVSFLQPTFFSDYEAWEKRQRSLVIERICPPLPPRPKFTNYPTENKTKKNKR